MTDQGIAVAYTITKVSFHDVNMVPTLIDQYSCPHVLADAGYLSKKLKVRLARLGVDFWTPRCKNMSNNGTDSRLLIRDRRQIETVFSGWINTFDLERNRARSLNGFQTRIEQCLLVDTLKQIN
ncbi:hypothetical protein CPR19088_GLDEOEPO_02338 [Companilactobacillus paralimentarius]|uniref:Transposase DDE domain-containing protein n=1 Tax=Companilactobacillus nantensis DSM 16982 TaxID=1423774 RepID=A0A0R1WE50_9LACO|nr:hypothetical protein FD31_GL001801 [Companilactobacillus nantensis DSM 16982]GEO65239.1 hypothetical protein LNA01_24220 [Companilactobacillus nantensis]